MGNSRNFMRLLPIFGCIDATGCAYKNVASNGEPSWKVMSKLLKTARQVIEIAKTTMTILTVAIEGL